MSDKFFNPVEVPVIVNPPVPEAGFVRIYGRGSDAYAIFPDGEEKLLTGGVVVVPGTDRDISFPDNVLFDDNIKTAFTLADTAAISDAPQTSIVLADSARLSDAVNGAGLSTRSNDSLAVSEAASATLAFDAQDSAAIADFQTFAFVITDSAAASDARQAADITAVNWAGAVISSDNFTDTGNMVDLNEATSSDITAQQTALSGTVTEAGNITVSLPDPDINPAPSINSVELRWGWTTTLAGTLQNANSLSVVIAYSLDDGDSFTTMETVTNTDGTGDETATITATYAELLRVRFRATATVTSGTAATLNARQDFRFRYAKCAFDVSQTL